MNVDWVRGYDIRQNAYLNIISYQQQSCEWYSGSAVDTAAMSAQVANLAVKLGVDVSALRVATASRQPELANQQADTLRKSIKAATADLATLESSGLLTSGYRDPFAV